MRALNNVPWARLLQRLVLGAFCLLGCSDPGGEELGQAPGDAAGDSHLGESSATLELPEPARMTPCPNGWREVTDDVDGVTICDPWPEGGRQRCQGGQAHFPGEPSCAPIGSPCPEGDWAEDLPDDRPLVFVRGGVSAPGDGSREAPFATLTEAVAAAEPGSVVALARGTYEESVTITDDLAVHGACVAETRISAPPFASFPDDPLELGGTITVAAGAVEVTNLQLGGGRPGVVVEEGAAVHVRQVLIAEAAVAGVFSKGGRVTAETLVIRDTRDVPLGVGVWSFSAEVELRRAVLERNHTGSIWLVGAGRLTLEDTALLDTRLSGFVDIDGVALSADIATQVDVSRSVFSGHPGASVVRATFDESGSDDPERAAAMTIRDTLIRGPSTSDRGGTDATPGGIVALRAPITLERVLVEQVEGINLRAAFETELTLRDVIIRDSRNAQTTPPNEDERQHWGYGILLANNVESVLERVMLLRTQGVALWSFDSTVTGSDVTISDTQALPCEEVNCPVQPGSRAGGARSAVSLGTGAVSMDESSIDLSGFLVSECTLAGLQLVGGTADLDRGTVRRNLIGVNVQTEGFDVERLSHDVVYLDNDRNIDSSELPVPDIGAVEF